MSTPLPEDFPGLDLEAWVKALPMPEPGSNLDRIVHEVLTTLPLPLVLGSDASTPKPPRFRRHPK